MSDETARCAACGVELAPGMLACPACRKLVHADRLTSLAAEAGTAEREGRLTDALIHWRAALELLPEETTQRRAVAEKIRVLGEAIDRSGSAAPAAKGGRGKGAAGLGALGLLAWNFKLVILSFLGKAKLLITGLASLPTLLSMFAYLAIRPGRWGAFAVGIVASIYVHEMGHVHALRLYGIKATAPMFVPGFGALVRLHQYPINAREDARVGLAGPVWGCAAAAVALALGALLHAPTLLAVGSLGATLNLFNLIPFWQLDGARGFRALDTRQRTVVVVLAGLAALALSQPMGWLVAAVGGVRVKSDLPTHPTHPTHPAKGDGRAFYTMAGLVVVLSLMGWMGRAAG